MKKLLLVVAFAMVVIGCSPNSPIQVNTPVPETTVPNSEVTVPGVTIRIKAPGPNPQEDTPNELGNVAGILMGIWHGFIAPVTLAISFFNPQVQMYEVHNDGNMYNLGFMLGLVLFCAAFLLVGRSRRGKK